MNNPFTSERFVAIWSKHFNKAKKPLKYQFIDHVSFYKKKFLPLYVNIGKNLTKGIYYSLNYDATDFKNKVFLIYDVPQFFDVAPFDARRSVLKCDEIFQYQGFLLDFTEFPTAQDYVNSRVSSKNRRGLHSRQVRLEKCFDITYRYYKDDITKDEFDLVFSQFHELLSDRFSGKKVNYHHLSPDKWAFHSDFSYTMLKENKALLFVIYNGDTPIAITLNILSENVVFVAITVFDPNFYKFYLGKITIVKIIEWCYEHNYKIADFSKGDFDFKHEWCNVTYDFNYHLLYDSKSIQSKFVAWLTKSFFDGKRYLREKNANVMYRKVLYKLKKKEVGFAKPNFKIDDLDRFETDSSYEVIDLEEVRFRHLKIFVYSFLVSNSDPLNEVVIYKKQVLDKEFVIKGSKKSQRVTFY